jgi:hypothetical protein
MAGKAPSKGTPADQRLKGRGQKPGPKPQPKGSKGK